MEPIAWKADYDTGIKEIDEQHRQLVNMLAELQDAVVADPESGEIGARLMAFVKYTKAHLHSEESLMRRISFSGYKEHKAQHERLVSQFVLLLQKLKSGNDMTPADLVNFMRRWLIDHIVEEDAEIGKELRVRLDASAQSTDSVR